VKRKMDERILLAHGGGGELMRGLIRDVFVSKLSNDFLTPLGDSAILDVQFDKGERVAFTTDSYVVKPLFFQGGDIGRLSVCGTVNDLAMAGARPLFLSLSLILEEGYSVDDLEQITTSIQLTAQEAKVQVVTGDTKVVEKGAADGLFITTAGLGVIPEKVNIASSRIEMSDVLIVNGFLGDHGIAILHERGSYDFNMNIKSDVAPLFDLVERLYAAKLDIHFMRDLTRGGLAAALNEICAASQKAIEIDEAAVPVRREVSALCEMLGLDPFHVANEGKCVIICAQSDAERALHVLRGHAYGRNARVIGQISNYRKPLVIGKTAVGGSRVISMPSGRYLPRIC
jgi:hydrogenase expression/formation protein HypE